MAKLVQPPMPRDVLAMLHLLSRWLQSSKIEELRIAPGRRGSDEARLTRITRMPEQIQTATGNPRAPAKRHIAFAEPKREATLQATLELLPLSRSGGL